MKSVVMIAYFFPPEGNAGSYRPLRFVRHLSEFHWRASVVTAKPYNYERYDPDLLQQVPREVEIVRVRGHDFWHAIQARRTRRTQEIFSKGATEVAEKLRTSRRKPIRSTIRDYVRTVEAWCYQPDMARPWIRPATKATIELCMRKRAEVIWATAGPISAWIVAQQASRRVGVPFVLDLRDPHGLGYYDHEVRQPQWIRRRMRSKMYDLFSSAQSVVFLFEAVAESYSHAFPGALDSTKIHIIPNGYDGAMEEFLPPNGDSCIFLYTGTISSYRYDTLLEALLTFKRSDPDKAKTLQLKFIGEGMDELAHRAAMLGLSDIVTTAEPTSYSAIERLQREAHVLLVLGRPATTIGYELVAGAKLFDYLRARRPIIGVLPRDETQKILKSLGVSSLADVDLPSDIAGLLRRVQDAWLKGTLSSFLPARKLCELYSAEQQTKALVRALSGLPSKPPFIPGQIQIPLSLQKAFGT